MGAPQVALHSVLDSRGLGLPPPEPTVASSRGSLTFPILSNAGMQPGMRQLRIVPAGAAAAVTSTAELQPEPRHRDPSALPQVRRAAGP